jgi:hypothetical protein
MNRRCVPALLLFLLMPAAHAGGCDSLDAVNWLLGNWVRADAENMTLETWHRVSADTFEGVGTTESYDGEILRQESLRLVVMSGKVFYIAKVTENDLPVPFVMTLCTDGEMTFENPAHDFPRRLIYWHHSPDSANTPETMTVRVDDGADKGFSITFARHDPPGETHAE